MEMGCKYKGVNQKLKLALKHKRNSKYETIQQHSNS